MKLEQLKKIKVRVTYNTAVLAEEEREVNVVHRVDTISISSLNLMATSSIITELEDGTYLSQSLYEFKFNENGLSVVEQAYRAILQNEEYLGSKLVQ